MILLQLIIIVVLFMLINYIMSSQDPSYGFKEFFGADFKVETKDFKYNPIKDYPSMIFLHR